MNTPATSRFHPRELEMAELLGSQDLDWQIQTGDWFYADSGHHIVMQVFKRGGETWLVSQNGARYPKDKVLRLPHRFECRQWLMERGWESEAKDADGGLMRVVARERNTGVRVERAEPTELAACYAILIEVSNQIDYAVT